MKYLFGFAVLLLSGCAVLRPAPTPAPPLLSPAGYGSPKTLQQQVKITHGDQTRVYTALVDLKPDSVTMIWFGPLGARLFSLRWDGHSLRSEGPARLPSALSPAWLLADVQTVYAPLPELQALLARSDWEVAQPRPDTRTLTRDGDVQLEVAYTPAAAAGNEVTIRHVPWGLAIHIVSRPVSTADHSSHVAPKK